MRSSPFASLGRTRSNSVSWAICNTLQVMCLSLRCTGLSGSAAAFTLKVLATPPTDHHYRDLCHPEFRIRSSIYIPIFESYFGGWGGVRGPTSGVLGNYSWRFLFTCCTNKCIPRSFRGAGGSSILPGCKPPLSASLRGRPPSPQYSTIGCERNMERGVYRFFGVFFPSWPSCSSCAAASVAYCQSWCGVFFASFLPTITAGGVLFCFYAGHSINTRHSALLASEAAPQSRSDFRVSAPGSGSSAICSVGVL